MPHAAYIYDAIRTPRSKGKKMEPFTKSNLLIWVRDCCVPCRHDTIGYQLC